MYRYLLFYCDTFYPSGGMKDCVLKTNNFDDLEQFIHDNYEDDWYMGTIAYYDAAKDKYITADMETYDDEGYYTRWRFLGWEEEENE